MRASRNSVMVMAEHTTGAVALSAAAPIACLPHVGIVSKTPGHSNSAIRRDLYGMFVATAKAAAEGISSRLPARKSREGSGVLTSVLTEQRKTPGTCWFRRLNLQGWQMRDSNPRRRCQLIYSQPPLAARVICRTSKEDHSRLPCSERLFPVRSASSNRGQDNFTELPPKNRIGAPRSKAPKSPENQASPRMRPASLDSNLAACSSVIWFSCTARARSAWTPSSLDEASAAGLKMIEAASVAAATDVAAVAQAACGGRGGADDVADGLVLHGWYLSSDSSNSCNSAAPKLRSRPDSALSGL